MKLNKGFSRENLETRAFYVLPLYNRLIMCYIYFVYPSCKDCGFEKFPKI